MPKSRVQSNYTPLISIFNTDCFYINFELINYLYNRTGNRLIKSVTMNEVVAFLFQLVKLNLLL